MGGESGAPAIPYCRSLSLLGERAAGTLYAADSDRYGGAVTVTVYPRPADDRARSRFEAAVETARRLGEHPHIVTIHASGHTDGDGRPYVVSDGHDRTTAQGVLATSGVLGVDSVLPIGIALAGALETAHRAGIVHGGVEPGVVLLRPSGHPVLAEVGLSDFARPSGASAALARWIPYHAPPEILEDTSVTPATDVYSLASVVYTLLVGQPPHAGTGIDDSTASLLLRILQLPMPAIERSDVPPGLEDTLRTALSHSPAKRPQHALELAWAMQEAQRMAGLEVSEPLVLGIGTGAGSAAAGAAPATPPEAGGGAAGGRRDWSLLAPPAAPAAPVAPAAPPTPALPTNGTSVFAPQNGTASPAGGNLLPAPPERPERAGGFDAGNGTMGANPLPPVGNGATGADGFAPGGGELGAGNGIAAGQAPGQTPWWMTPPGGTAAAAPPPAAGGLTNGASVFPLATGPGTDDPTNGTSVFPPATGPGQPGGPGATDDLPGRASVFPPAGGAYGGQPGGPPAVDRVGGASTGAYPASGRLGSDNGGAGTGAYPGSGPLDTGNGGPGSGAYPANNPLGAGNGNAGPEAGAYPASSPLGGDNGIAGTGAYSANGPGGGGGGFGSPGGFGSQTGGLDQPTPWWATPPGGTAAAAPPAAAGGVDLGPLNRPAIDPEVLAEALRRHGTPAGQPGVPVDSPLHQPLPSDERPPLDRRKLEAFDPARPVHPMSLPNRPPTRRQAEAPALPQARQSPTSPTSPDQTAEPGDGQGRRSRRAQRRDRGRAAAEESAATAAAPAAPGTRDHPPAAGFAGAITGVPVTGDRPLSALERARQARLERQRLEREGHGQGQGEEQGGAEPPPDAEAAPRRPIGATPDMAVNRAGPPALPVIVLVVVVIILGLGGAWMVIKGEGGSAGPAADETSRQSGEGSSDGTASTTAPANQAFSPNLASNLTAVETDGGVQLDWEGPEGAAYLVRILSPTEPPRPLGAGPATALMVPADMVQPGGAYCFDIVAAPEEGQPPVSTPSDPAEVAYPTACVGGAQPDQVIRP